MYGNIITSVALGGSNIKDIHTFLDGEIIHSEDKENIVCFHFVAFQSPNLRPMHCLCLDGIDVDVGNESMRILDKRTGEGDQQSESQNH